MKCDVLVAQKMGSIPVIELRYAILRDNERIIVPQELSKKLQENYKRRLIKVGEVERESLGQYGFHYDLWQKPVANLSAAILEEPEMEVAPEFSDVNKAADKSMFSKLRKRK